MQALEATADSLSAVGGKINPTDEKALNDYVKAQQKLSEQMQIAINVVHEAYPDLKANENYLNLLTQLEGAENRIAVACKDYNFVVKDYNKAIKKLGKERVEDSDFKEVPLIKQEECAEKAPDVSGMLE